MLLRSAVALFLSVAVGFADGTHPTLARDGLGPRIAALDAGQANQQMELAFLTALRAIENAVQFQIKQGIGRSMIGLPFVGFAPARSFGRDQPQPAPDALRRLTLTLLDELEGARSALAAIEDPAAAAFVLDVNDLWFDLDSDGQRGAKETVAQAMLPILGRRAVRMAKERQKESDAPIVIRFDEADIHWLTAYTHALSALGNAVLAFDPTPILEALKSERAALQNAPEVPVQEHIAAAMARIEILTAQQDQLEARADGVAEELDPLREALATLQGRVQQTIAGALRRELEAQRDATGAEIRRLDREMEGLEQQYTANLSEIERLSALLPDTPRMQNRPVLDSFGQTVDAVYVLIEALRQQPNAENLNAARFHWGEMIRENRSFWRHVNQETDNDREWVPNPAQDSAIGITISEETAQTWQDILSEAEALAEGSLLIPHPLLPAGMGISLADYFDTPAPLDLLGWVHGRASYPYARRGSVMSPANWRRLQGLSRGNATILAIFLN